MTGTETAILVVDDESGILDALRMLLKNAGFQVETAQGGKAGLEALKTTPPDIVLTDIRMPQVTGINILEAVRELDPETPVILMTAQASLQSAISAVNQGAFYYIQKPFANDEMIAICRRRPNTASCVPKTSTSSVRSAAANGKGVSLPSASRSRSRT